MRKALVGIPALCRWARFAAIAGELMPGSPTDFGKFISDETEKWAKVVKFAGLKAERGPGRMAHAQWWFLV